ncbi:hypothetical protein L6Q96_11565 [Candidatus Binatia bacterium]|nr:hypothetical protein [Candidatus Binatia bacterium]
MTADEKLKLTVRSLRTVLLLCALAPAAPARAQPTIAPRVAGLYVGQERVVEGKVLSAQREGNTVRLRFGTGPNDFVATLSIGLLSDFPENPDEAYVGKTVRVAGSIKSFRGVPEIGLRDASNIEVVNPRTTSERSEPAPAPAAAIAVGTASAPDSPRSELEALRAQVEALTRRVEVLERKRATDGNKAE